MKTLKMRIQEFFTRMEEQWRKMPVEGQRHLTILFFAGYSLLSLFTLVQIVVMGRETKQRFSLRSITIPEDMKIPVYSAPEKNTHSPQKQHYESTQRHSGQNHGARER